MPFFLLFFSFPKKRKWMIAFLVFAISNTVSASDKVLVKLNNGNEVIGVESEPKDASKDHLWILREDPGIKILSGFPRENVVSIQPWKNNKIEQLPVPKTESININKGPSSSVEDMPSRSVATVEITACVKNWDNDSLSDGIEVIVRPLDNYGNLVQTNGVVDFQLLGQRTAWKTSNQLKYFHDFDVITTWSKSLRAGDLTPQGYRFRLEFRNTHPDYDLDLDLEALVHARLNLVGQPVLESNSGPVLLRPFSKLRDDLQQFNGNRFFPEEHAPGL